MVPVIAATPNRLRQISERPGATGVLGENSKQPKLLGSEVERRTSPGGLLGSEIYSQAFQPYYSGRRIGPRGRRE